MTTAHAIQTEALTGAVHPDHILQIGMGFWASKTLLSAVELDLFTELSGGGLTATQIADRLDLHQRSRDDFLDALVSLGLLARDGDGPGAVYSNTPDTAVFLDKGSPAYLGGILEMSSARLYGFWGSLTEALHTGLPQNEIKTGAPGLFDGVYADPERLQTFLNGMTGLQIGAFTALSHTLDLSSHTTFCDIGGANGGLAAMITGIAGHFVSERATLGVMKTRQSEMKFPANPRLVNGAGERVEPYKGPVAILVDGMTGSASECFSGGLQPPGPPPGGAAG